MDERKISELFRDAVPDLPPPTFDHNDVATESHRQQRRHRNALLGGSALGVALLAGAAVLGVALWKGTDANSTAAGSSVAGANGNTEIAPNEVPGKDAAPPPSGKALDRNFPTESPKQGGTPNGNAGPSGPGSTPRGCGQADPELAAALAGELRAAAPNPGLNAVALTVDCPPNAHGAAYAVTVNGRSGTVSLVVTPDSPVANPLAGKPDGSTYGVAYTQNGRQVVVVTQPGPGSTAAPYAEDVQRLANELSAKV